MKFPAVLMLLTMVGSSIDVIGAHDEDGSDREPFLKISAEGKVETPPEVATLTVGVETESEGAAAAMNTTSTTMGAVLTALRGQDIPDEDLQTSTLSLSAVYKYDPDTKENNLTGYKASNSITAQVGVGSAGEALDAAVGAGANQISGLRYGLEDDTRLAKENEAREAAVKALQAKAQLYARATGLNLGPLKSLTEDSVNYPRPYSGGYAYAAARSAAPTPVAPGQITVTARVSAKYAFVKEAASAE